jgi:hypothetical protein
METMNSDHDACLEVRGRHFPGRSGFSAKTVHEKIQAYFHSNQIYTYQSSPLTYVTGQLDQKTAKICLNAHFISY